MKSKLLLSLALTATTSFTAEPAFTLLKVDKPQLTEEFTGATIPENWKPGGRAKSFSVVDGALQGVCAADDSHGPAISVPVDAHDFAVRFSVRFVKPGYFLFLADGESQFGG
ncbi:MAG TPA: hypothetical protein VK968_18310, partial [Roseimicrobium sp.]|nr:hypothetical protein [Roseimicrobium sp.]